MCGAGNRIAFLHNGPRASLITSIGFSTSFSRTLSINVIAVKKCCRKVVVTAAQRASWKRRRK
jgi:hypothetical protein|tara:strand:+ start:1267 stop:1455 length:189 start_codon:yes stop_codon:yes gene_type:complete